MAERYDDFGNPIPDSKPAAGAAAATATAAAPERYDDYGNPVGGQVAADIYPQQAAAPKVRIGGAADEKAAAYADTEGEFDPGNSFGKAFSAFGSGIKRSTIDPILALHRAGKDEADNGGVYLWGATKAAGKSMLEGSQQEEDKAAEALQRDTLGGYVEGFGHHLAASIPVIGPLWGGIAENLGEGIGDPSTYKLAESTGEIAGLYAPEGAARFGKGLREIVPPPPGVSKGLTGVIEKSGLVPAKGVFEEYRLKQHAAQLAEYEKAVADLEKGRTADIAAAEQSARQIYGERLVSSHGKLDASQQAFARNHQALIDDARAQVARLADPNIKPQQIVAEAADNVMQLKTAAQELYGEVDKAVAPTPGKKVVTVSEPTSVLGPDGKPVMKKVQKTVDTFEGGAQVDLTGFKTIAARYQKMLDERIISGDAAKIRGQLDAIVSGPDVGSYSAASGTASDLMDISRAIDEPLPKLRAKISAELSTELKRATNAAVKDFSPEAASQLERANELWAKIHKPAVVDLLERAETGQTLHDKIFSKEVTTQDLQDLREAVGEPAYKALAARAFADAIEADVRRGLLENKFEGPGRGPGEPGAPAAATEAPASKVTLYRAEPVDPNVDLPSYGMVSASDLDAASRARGRGGWYTTSEADARYYKDQIQHQGHQARLRKIELTAEEAKQYLARNNKEAAKFSDNPERDHFLPPEARSKSTVIDEMAGSSEIERQIDVVNRQIEDAYAAADKAAARGDHKAAAEFERKAESFSDGLQELYKKRDAADAPTVPEMPATPPPVSAAMAGPAKSVEQLWEELGSAQQNYKKTRAAVQAEIEKLGDKITPEQFNELQARVQQAKEQWQAAEDAATAKRPDEAPTPQPAAATTAADASSATPPKSPIPAMPDFGDTKRISFERLGGGLADTITELERQGKLEQLFPETANQLRKLAEYARMNPRLGKTQIPSMPKMPEVSLKPLTDAEVKQQLGPEPKVFEPKNQTVAAMTNIAAAALGVYSMIGLRMKHSIPAFAATIGVGGSAYVFARIMTNPAGANAMLRYMKAVSEGNARTIAITGQQVANLVAKEAIEAQQQKDQQKQGGNANVNLDIYPQSQVTPASPVPSVPPVPAAPAGVQ